MANDTARAHIELVVALASAAHDFLESNTVVSSRLAIGALTDSPEDRAAVDQYRLTLDTLAHADEALTAYRKENGYADLLIQVPKA